MSLMTKNDPESKLWNARIGYINLLASTDTGDADGTLRANTYERYRPAGGTVTIKYQLSTSSEINYIGIAAHNFGTHQIDGVGVTVSYAETVGGALIDIDYVQQTNNRPMFFIFDTVEAAEIAITLDAPVEGVEYGVVFSGIYLEMQRPIYGGHSPINLSAKTEYQSTISESGNFLGRSITRKGSVATFSWQNLEPDWYRENFQPLVEFAKTTPFFIMWRPDLYSDEVAYCETVSDIMPTNQGGGTTLMNVSVSVRGHEDL